MGTYNTPNYKFTSIDRSQFKRDTVSSIGQGHNYVDYLIHANEAKTIPKIQLLGVVM